MFAAAYKSVLRVLVLMIACWGAQVAPVPTNVCAKHQLLLAAAAARRTCTSASACNESNVHMLIMLVLRVQVRKQERVFKQAADEHATAVLAVESKLAGKQREVADLQELNTRLFGRFQAMREQLARNEDKLSHEKLKGETLCILVHGKLKQNYLDQELLPTATPARPVVDTC